MRYTRADWSEHYNDGKGFRRLEDEARTLLDAHASGGSLTEQAVFTVLLARRGGGAQ